MVGNLFLQEKYRYLSGYYHIATTYLDIPCWNFSMFPSYLPPAMSWTSWAARLSWISSFVFSPWQNWNELHSAHLAYRKRDANLQTLVNAVDKGRHRKTPSLLAWAPIKESNERRTPGLASCHAPWWWRIHVKVCHSCNTLMKIQ